MMTEKWTILKNRTNKKEFKRFQFDKKVCCNCPLKDQYLYKNKNGKISGTGRIDYVPLRYNVVLNDMKRNITEEFVEASNKRFKIERRFATRVRNHGLRRWRHLRLKGAKIHITLANMVCNIVRMVNLLYPPSIAMSYIEKGSG